MKRKTGTPAYRVTIADGQPHCTWSGVVSPDIIVEPDQAVEALRQHGFDEIYIAITQTSADTISYLWNQIDTPTGENAMTPFQALERAYINQIGETITIPRTLAEELIDSLGSETDPDSTICHYLRQERTLSPIERALLKKLADNPGVIVLSETLINVSHTANNESLWVHVFRLRKKLNDRAVIQTVNSMGYMLEIRETP